MARISNYPEDARITAEDKLLGTDGGTGVAGTAGQSKNFSLGGIKNYALTHETYPAKDQSPLKRDYDIHSTKAGTGQSALTYRFDASDNDLTVMVAHQDLIEGVATFHVRDYFSIANEGDSGNVTVKFKNEDHVVPPLSIMTFEYVNEDKWTVIGSGSGASSSGTVGPQGPQGEKGEPGVKGDTGVKGDPAASSNNVKITRTDYAQLVADGNVDVNTFYFIDESQ